MPDSLHQSGGVVGEGGLPFRIFCLLKNTQFILNLGKITLLLKPHQRCINDYQ